MGIKARPPPVLKRPTEKDKDLPLEEKLNMLDRNIQSICDYGRSIGMSEKEMRRAAAPLFKAAFKEKLKINFKKALLIILLASIISFVLYFMEPAQRIITIYGRIFMVKLLPYWDWTKLYYKTCLMDNPYYESKKLTLEDCQACEPMDGIEHLVNTSDWGILQDYISNDIPVIVMDAMDSWPAMVQPFYIDNITRIYLNHSDIDNFAPCAMSTNLRHDGSNFFKGVLKKMKTGERRKWFAHWENCDKKATKAVRFLYKRPYFLPLMIDMTEPNWIFISSGYRSRVYKQVQIVNDLLWISQVRGSSRIRLTPKEPCGSVCPKLTDNLYEGEILLFTDYMWKYEYKPGEEDDDNIAIAVGGLWGM